MLRREKNQEVYINVEELNVSNTTHAIFQKIAKIISIISYIKKKYVKISFETLPYIVTYLKALNSTVH